MRVNSELVILTISVFFTSSFALNCYQCSGSDPSEPFQCNEGLNDDIDIQPEPCDKVYGAQYCVKHIGRFEGGIGAKRYCSSLDMGNYCNYVKQPGDVLNYRTCFYTCTGDGCNPANNVTPNKLMFLFLFFSLFGLRYFIR